MKYKRASALLGGAYAVSLLTLLVFAKQAPTGTVAFSLEVTSAEAEQREFALRIEGECDGIVVLATCSCVRVQPTGPCEYEIILECAGVSEFVRPGVLIRQATGGARKIVELSCDSETPR